MTPEQRIDAALDSVLKASGSALRHYTMPKTLADMREAMRKAMFDEYIRGLNESISKRRPPGAEALHAAVCQAVALLNRAPEVARCAEGREARDLLRQALVDYADAYMDEPVTERERSAVAAKHQRKPRVTIAEASALTQMLGMED